MVPVPSLKGAPCWGGGGCGTVVGAPRDVIVSIAYGCATYVMLCVCVRVFMMGAVDAVPDVAIRAKWTAGGPHTQRTATPTQTHTRLPVNSASFPPSGKTRRDAQTHTRVEQNNHRRRRLHTPVEATRRTAARRRAPHTSADPKAFCFVFCLVVVAGGMRARDAHGWRGGDYVLI